MKKLTTMLLLMSMLSGGVWAQMPTSKVDLSIGNRSDDETLEPGYTVWRVASGKSDALTIDGITYTFSVPEGTEYQIRTGWNKTYIQNADNKAKNGRLTGDGLSLDPATACGQIDLTITGLPKGTHYLPQPLGEPCQLRRMAYLRESQRRGSAQQGYHHLLAEHSRQRLSAHHPTRRASGRSTRYGIVLYR